MVENHIHHNLYASFVRFSNELAILLICPETWVNFVIISSSIAMIGTTFHIVFQYRSKPKSGYT